MKKVKKGMALYQIGANGILTGTYTNEFSYGEVNDVIAAKQTKEKGIIGTYDTVCFEGAKKKFKAILKITLISKNIYSVIWKNNNDVTCTGIGYIMNKKQFVVRYEAN